MKFMETVAIFSENQTNTEYGGKSWGFC